MTLHIFQRNTCKDAIKQAKLRIHADTTNDLNQILKNSQ